MVAVAVVAQAVWGMARQLAPDRPRATIALLTAIATLAWPTALGQVLLIGAAGLVGGRLLPAPVWWLEIRPSALSSTLVAMV